MKKSVLILLLALCLAVSGIAAFAEDMGPMTADELAAWADRLKTQALETAPELPASVPVTREGENLIITYSPAEYPTAELISRLQEAGTIREMTVQPRNIDHLVAAMYQEMDL